MLLLPMTLLFAIMLALLLVRFKWMRQCCCVLCYYAWCCCCCARAGGGSGGSNAKDVSTDFEMAERRGDGSARKVRTPSRRGDVRLDDDDGDDEDEEASLLAEVGIDDFEAEVNPFAATTPDRRPRAEASSGEANPFSR